MECSCSWREAEIPAWCRDCPSTPIGLNQAAKSLQQALGIAEEQIVLSCLEFIEPHPHEAVRLLGERGFDRVVVMPFLLGNGKHATIELDETMEDIRDHSQGLELHLAEGFGPDPTLAGLVAQRVNEVKGPHGSSPYGVLLVKAGTKSEYDDCVWLEELGALVEGQLGPEYAIAVAQSHYGNPTMDDAAVKLVETRLVSTIVCVPYLFFPGLILHRNVLGGLDTIQQRYPNVSIAVTAPLGINKQIVAVTADRVRTAWNNAVTT